MSKYVTNEKPAAPYSFDPRNTPKKTVSLEERQAAFDNAPACHHPALRAPELERSDEQNSSRIAELSPTFMQLLKNLAENDTTHS